MATKIQAKPLNRKSTRADIARMEASIKRAIQPHCDEIDQRLARIAAEMGYVATGNPDCPYLPA